MKRSSAKRSNVKKSKVRKEKSEISNDQKRVLEKLLGDGTKRSIQKKMGTKQVLKSDKCGKEVDSKDEF